MSNVETIAISNSGKYSVQVLAKNSGTTTTFTNCNVKYQRSKSLALPEAFRLSNDGELGKIVREEGREDSAWKVVDKYNCQSTVNTVVYTWGVDISQNRSDAFGLFDLKAFGNINTSEFIVITDKIIR